MDGSSAVYYFPSSDRLSLIIQHDTMRPIYARIPPPFVFPVGHDQRLPDKCSKNNLPSEKKEQKPAIDCTLPSLNPGSQFEVDCGLIWRLWDLMEHCH